MRKGGKYVLLRRGKRDKTSKKEGKWEEGNWGMGVKRKKVK